MTAIPAYPWATGDILHASALRASLGLHARPAREFGVVPDTEADQGPALRAAMEAVRAAGGGAIAFEPRPYFTSRLPPVTGVHLVGAISGTPLISPPGAGGVIIGNDNFAAMVGTDDFTGAAPHDFGIYDLIGDGNAANQSVTGGARDFACPFQIYGYHYRAHRITYRNPVGHGFRSAWGRYGEFPMQAEILQIEGLGAPRHGVWWDGPHDSFLEGILPVDSSAEADNTWCGVITGINGGSHWTRVHPWHESAATNRMRAAFSSAGGSIVDDSQFEGARTLFESFGGDRIAGKFYASFGAAGDCMLDVRGNLTVVAAGSTFENSTAADIFAIRLGRAGAKVSGFVMAPGLIGGFGTRGAVDFAGSAGGNRIIADGYGNLAPAGYAATDTLDLNFNSPTVRIHQGPLDPGPYASATAAKAANPALRYGDRFLRPDGLVAWVNV